MRGDFDIGGQPTRVTRIRVVITPPHDLPIQRRDAFLAVASHCTVHNTLTNPAPVDILLSETARSSHEHHDRFDPGHRPDRGH